MNRVDPAAALAQSREQSGPPIDSVRKVLRITRAALGVAALLQVLIYLLLVINRTRLLHPVVAGGALWLSRLASLAAIAAVISCAVLLTRWLIARRAAAFGHHNLPESRPEWALRAGCLVPLVNLAWAPVYVMELADREGQLARLRKPIVVWWLLWTLATAVAVLAMATSRVQDAQGIANNTTTMILAYLLGLAALVAAANVFEGFESRPVRRPAHHWVVVADDRAPAAALEPAGREPAA